MLARLIVLSLAIVSLASSGCESDEPTLDDEGGSPTVRSVDRFEAPDDEGALTAGERSAADELKEELTTFHGQRPRKYNGLLNGNVEAERCYADFISEVTAYVNAQLAARGHNERVEEYELTTNFITEGGYFVLNGNKTTGIDGYGELGVDTLVSNYAALKPYLHPMVERLVDAGETTVEQTNEKGETVYSLTDMNIEEGLYANAGMFAYERGNVASDMNNPALLRRWCERKKKTPHPGIEATDLASLPQWQQFFWTTLYFNAGTGRGRQFLCQEWLGWASESYDGPENNRIAKFNVAWRTATYRYMIGTAGPSIGAYCERRHGSACECDGCALIRDCAECAAADGCGYCEGSWQCTSSAEGCGTHVTEVDGCTASTTTEVRPCETAVSCSDCFSAGAGDCGWCGSTNTCAQGASEGPASGSCDAWQFDSCDPAPCAGYTCGECLGESGCGYCLATNACGLGSSGGPASGECLTWTTDPISCGDEPMVMPDSGVPDVTPPVCGGEGSTCLGDPDCCDEGGELGRCVADSCALCAPSVAGISETCDPASPGACCGVAVCAPVADPTDNRCCLTDTFACQFSTDCCGAMQCEAGSCACQTAGEACLTGRECCGALFCSGGVCVSS